MSVLQILAGPLIGAVIGYITNYIAIKMLFRPLEAKYFCGRRLPFTPGIVPRRKNALAKILGNAIVEKFFNADDLEVVFQSAAFSDAVADRLAKTLRSDLTIGEVLADTPEDGLYRLKEDLCANIIKDVYESEIPEYTARQGGVFLREMLPSDSVLSKAAAGAYDSMTDTLTEKMRGLLIDEGLNLSLPIAEKEFARIQGEPVSAITGMISEDPDALKEKLRALYAHFMAKNVRPIVESIDVGGMITEKIIQMSPLEVETLVLMVVRRELNLVVLFGAFLGALIGAVNIFI